MRTVTMNLAHLLQWPYLDNHLEQIFWTLVNLWPDTNVTVTSINRSKKRNAEVGSKSLIHVVGPPWRAIDISIKTLPGGQKEAERLASILNELWSYDHTRPDKPVAYAKTHGTGPHIHLQSHPHTARR